jgi:hypothetical protein
LGTRAPDGKPLVFVPLVSDVPPLPVGVLCVKGAMNRSTPAAFLAHCIAALS